jgi:ribosomal protein S18 acetylase RimI-like enzyme
MPAELPSTVHLRDTVLPTDPAAVRQIVASTGFFHPPEIDVAVELVQEHLSRGPASGYFFLFAEQGGKVIGYTCYGPIACTVGSFDLYWIAVHNDQRGRGLGRHLLAATEKCIAQSGGRRVYIETSGRAQYAPTQHFYEACAYVREAVLADFYAPGDDKIIYGKVIGHP